MKVYKTKEFSRFARRERIGDRALSEAVARAERGLIDANLGGGLIKQRVARAGAGRSGGYRTIIAYRERDQCFFIYGFAKNERDNVNAEDLADLKQTGASLMNMDSRQMAAARATRELLEVDYDD